MKYNLLGPNGRAPTQAYDGAAGYDFYAARALTLHPFDPDAYYTFQNIGIDDYLRGVKEGKYRTAVGKVKTEIAIQLPVDHVGLFRDRSSFGAGSILVTAGVIDCDYRGEIEICLLNLSYYNVVIPAGSKVAQMLVMPVATQPPQEEKNLSVTVRGSKGFGSTGAS